MIIGEIERYLESIGAKFASFDKPNHYGPMDKHFISIKMSNGDVVIFEIEPTDDSEQSCKLTIYNDINGSKMKSYSNNRCTADIVFQKIKKYEKYMKCSDKLSLTESDIKMMVEESFKRILSESFDSYMGTNHSNIAHIINLISNKLSGMDGVRVSDTYTNNDRVVIEMRPNFGNEGRVMKIMSDLGYSYYSSTGGVSSRIFLVFKRNKK